MSYYGNYKAYKILKKITNTVNTTIDKSLNGGTLLVDSTTGDRNIFLPLISDVGESFFFYVKKNDSSLNNVNIISGENIEQGNIFTFNSHNNSYEIRNNGIEWFIISSYEKQDYSLPDGIISIWSGTIASIPAGWVLCDGTNGTPDLRDRFVVGARQDDAGVAKTNITGSLTVSGGNTSVTSAAGGNHNHGGAAQNHTLTISQLPTHNHTHLRSPDATEAPGPTPDISGNLAARMQGNAEQYSEGGSMPHNHNIVDSGTHTHDFTIIPSYYSLAYIMRI